MSIKIANRVAKIEAALAEIQQTIDILKARFEINEHRIKSTDFELKLPRRKRTVKVEDGQAAD